MPETNISVAGFPPKIILVHYTLAPPYIHIRYREVVLTSVINRKSILNIKYIVTSNQQAVVLAMKTNMATNFGAVYLMNKF